MKSLKPNEFKWFKIHQYSEAGVRKNKLSESAADGLNMGDPNAGLFYAQGVRRQVKEMLCNRLILCRDLARLSPNMLVSEEVFIIS